MNDRELLEAAARAAGLNVEWHFGCGNALAYVDRNASPRLFWNPLTDDGDALRLAVQLRLDVHFEMNGPEGETPIVEVLDAKYYLDNGSTFCAAEDGTQDPYAATRRAIVRAAAQMAQEKT